MFPFPKSDPEECCFSLVWRGAGGRLTATTASQRSQPELTTTHWNTALQGEDNTTTYGSGSQGIAWVGLMGLERPMRDLCLSRRTPVL